MKRHTIQGYAAVFGTPTEIAGMFEEQIARGAFREAIGRDDVRALLNHDANRVLGRTRSGTLRLSEDAKGLRYEIDVNPNDPEALSTLAKIERGDVDQSSFAFSVSSADEAWDFARAGLPMRTILAARLMDVSPCTFPAYTQTTAEAGDGQRAVFQAQSIGRTNPLAGDLFRSIQQLAATMTERQTACDHGCGRRAAIVRRTAGRVRLLCPTCHTATPASAIEPRARVNEDAWKRLERAREALPVSPDVAASRRRLAAAVRDEFINPTPAPTRPRRAAPHPAGDPSGYRTPKIVQTRWSETPDDRP